jgi:heme/copper-type cytochrome/quinol oxidase subunit 2
MYLTRSDVDEWLTEQDADETKRQNWSTNISLIITAAGFIVGVIGIIVSIWLAFRSAIGSGLI